MQNWASNSILVTVHLDLRQDMKIGLDLLTEKKNSLSYYIDTYKIGTQ